VAAVAQREGVVPVAARVVAGVARQVADGELMAGDLRQRGGQERSLEGLRGPVLAGEQPRVVERQPGAAAELLGQLELARGVLAAGLGVDAAASRSAASITG
jgi:hypothetical protein